MGQKTVKAVNSTLLINCSSSHQSSYFSTSPILPPQPPHAFFGTHIFQWVFIYPIHNKSATPSCRPIIRRYNQSIIHETIISPPICPILKWEMKFDVIIYLLVIFLTILSRWYTQSERSISNKLKYILTCSSSSTGFPRNCYDLFSVPLELTYCVMSVYTLLLISHGLQIRQSISREKKLKKNYSMI